MNVGIIGAGFTGLSAAHALVLEGHTVTVFEKDSKPGGLAMGYQEKDWEWSLEKHYHHWFTNDAAILRLAAAIEYPVLTNRPHTNWYINNKIYEFDSISSALSFPLLTPQEKLRHLFALGMLRIDPFWKPLEKLNAHTFLPKIMGKKAYELLWEPLFINKFGAFAKDISLAWFWARIKKRTQSLAYPRGGFLHFANHLTEKIRKHNGRVLFSTQTILLEEKNKQVRVTVKDIKEKKAMHEFDYVIVTLPSFLFAKLVPQLPSSYKDSLAKLKSLGATNLVLRLNKPFFPNNTYWLSIAERESPIMAIVEHTNFMDKKHYNNQHLVYLGKYLPTTDMHFLMDKEQLLSVYDLFLRKINPNYKKSLIGFELFKAPFAQPIIPTNYSTMIPSFHTPLKHVLLANIEQIYPWDRGTNYAVELGDKIANYLQKHTA